MKILILGHGRHGKDTVADMISEMYGYTFESSSMAAAEIAIFPTLAPKYGYKTVEECFEDRVNHRQEWKELITAYNTPDKSRLCREIIAGRDGYVGMRCPLEYEATRRLFDVVLWVDASERLPDDPTMDIEYCDYWMYRIDNNGSLADLRAEVSTLNLELLKTYRRLK